MNYKNLVANIAARSKHSPEIVRDILFHLPDALIQLNVGEKVRTPLGVFHMIHTKGRMITLPDGVTTAEMPSKTQVKLRPGLRLKLPYAEPIDPKKTG